MEFWFDYRQAWRKAPWLVLLALVGVVLVVVGVVGTIVRDAFALAFIPGLIVLLGHHLLVQKRL